MSRRQLVALFAIAIATLATGCLARSLAVDTQVIDVAWSIDAGTDLGCTPGRVDLPLMRIRSHLQTSVDDDEYFDWVPCVINDGFGVPLLEGVTAPLELGVYDVDAEMWTADRHQRLARAREPHTAILDNNPPDPVEVTIVMEPEAEFVWGVHDYPAPPLDE